MPYGSNANLGQGRLQSGVLDASLIEVCGKVRQSLGGIGEVRLGIRSIRVVHIK